MTARDASKPGFGSVHSPHRAILCLTWLMLAAGCGKPPEATFVSSQRTEELVRPLRGKVQESVQENFGTPQHLVAWLRLPIDYGTLNGRVAATAEQNDNAFEAAFDDGSKKEGSLAYPLTGLGLLWDSGPQVGAVAETRNGEAPIDFQVLKYEANKDRLTVNVLMEDPPEEGNTFQVVGHALQSGRKLYMTHCMHCHGVSGDGNGPTASYLNPRPRDYRLGIFKFTSTTPQDRVRRDDLHRVIRYGIPGTYMPSFLLLKDDELTSITEYVRWLSMRGEFEKRIVDGFHGDYSAAAIKDRIEGGETQAEIDETLKSEDFAEEYNESVEAAGDSIARIWNRAEEESSVVHPKTPRIDPAVDAKSIERGRTLYLSDKTKCVSCHGPAAHGDGPQTLAFQKQPNGKEYPLPGLYDDWGHPLKPRDLTAGIYRGGRRPVDLYRRIYSGIKGAAMPAFSTALKEEDIWDLVNYVLSVPYDGKAPPSLKPETSTKTADRSTAH